MLDLPLQQWRLYGFQYFGLLKGQVSTEHLHDLAKLLFGFVFFWAYIAFSQYILIWYANIPEETMWYLVRQENGWLYISLLLIVGQKFLAAVFRSDVSFITTKSTGARRMVRLLACDAMGGSLVARDA